MGKLIDRLWGALAERGRTIYDWIFRKAAFERSDPYNPLRLGLRGEREAFRYLRRLGYKVVARNYRSAHGEIDIVAWDRDILCFVEVKSRATTEHGRPEEAVTAFKQGQILNTSLDYLRQSGLHSVNIRYDIVSVFFRGDQAPVCRLIKRAFDPRYR